MQLNGVIHIGKWIKTFLPSYSSSQIIYVEAEAVDFLRFRFHRKRTASIVSASTFLFATLGYKVLIEKKRKIVSSNFVLPSPKFLLQICCYGRYRIKSTFSDANSQTFYQHHSKSLSKTKIKSTVTFEIGCFQFFLIKFLNKWT